MESTVKTKDERDAVPQKQIDEVVSNKSAGNTEEAIQGDILAVIADLHAVRDRLAALKDRAAALPAYEAAEVVNRKVGNIVVMTLALQLYSDLEQAVGPDPAIDERVGDEDSLSAVLWRLSRAARETEETVCASWGPGWGGAQ